MTTSSSSVKSFKDLIVWQKAMELTVQVYALTSTFGREERFRLTAQLTRAAASVPANIAEGHERGTRKDYANFLAIAKGSLAETETFLLLAQRLGYIDDARFHAVVELLREVGRMLTTLHARLRDPRRAAES